MQKRSFKKLTNHNRNNKIQSAEKKETKFGNAYVLTIE